MNVLEDAFSTVKNINHRKVVYFTSWHLWFDDQNYTNIYNSIHSISVLEMMEYLQPEYSVFYPHDLTCFYHESEAGWLDLFDLILLPFKNSDYYSLLAQGYPVRDIGWVKTRNNIVSAHITKPYKAVYFPSNVSAGINIYGSEEYARMISENIARTIPFKCGSHKKSQEQWVNVLKKDGFSFLDKDLSVEDVLEEYNLIIGDGDSSIIMEASLSGIPVISILDGFSSDDEYRKNLQGLKGVYPMHLDEVAAFLQELEENGRTLETGKKELRPFDYELLVRLIGI
jgi:hypothetical protein